MSLDFQSLDFLGESGKIESFKELEFCIRAAIMQGAVHLGIDVEKGRIVGLHCDWKDRESSLLPVELG